MADNIEDSSANPPAPAPAAADPSTSPATNIALPSMNVRPLDTPPELPFPKGNIFPGFSGLSSLGDAAVLANAQHQQNQQSSSLYRGPLSPSNGNTSSLPNYLPVIPTTVRNGQLTTRTVLPSQDSSSSGNHQQPQNIQSRPIMQHGVNPSQQQQQHYPYNQHYQQQQALQHQQQAMQLHQSHLLQNSPLHHSSTSSLSPPGSHLTSNKRESHKEIERKRREAINDGINQIASLLPREDLRNKGHILSTGAQYIRELQKKNMIMDIEIKNLVGKVNFLQQQNLELSRKLKEVQPTTDIPEDAISLEKREPQQLEKQLLPSLKRSRASE